MDYRLEVVVVPVSDVDRAKAFYADQVGFNVDVDTKMSSGMRVVQLTPPGSMCSIAIGRGTPAFDSEPGAVKGLQLVVSDLIAAHAELRGRGVEISEIQAFERESGAPKPYQPDTASGRDSQLDMMGFAYFSDPDGNGWAVQQMPDRG